VHTKHSGRKFGRGAGEMQMQMEESDQYAQQNAGAGYAGRDTADNQRTLAVNNVRTVNGVKYSNGQVPVASNF